jgi:hypothetical protein
MTKSAVWFYPSPPQLINMLSAAVQMALPQCISDQYCQCSMPLVFNGHECVDKTAWSGRPSQIVTPGGVPYVREDGTRVFQPHELLQMSDDDFTTVFQKHQAATMAKNMWPRPLYTSVRAHLAPAHP